MVFISQNNPAVVPGSFLGSHESLLSQSGEHELQAYWITSYLETYLLFAYIIMNVALIYELLER